MDKAIFGVENFDVYMVLGILILFGLLEVISGHFHKSKRSKGDWIQEVGGFFVLSVLIKPLIVFAVYSLGTMLFSETQFALAHWSLWLMLPFYLLMDDVLQYWYHRSVQFP